MDSPFEYIEDYFSGRMGEEERRLFEERCVNDESFARDVAFYVAQRKALRGELLSRKRSVWKARKVIRRLSPLRRRIYAVAAIVVLLISFYVLERPASPRQMAGRYLENNFAHLSATMNGSTDSLQLGIAAYNDGDYARALSFFNGLGTNNDQALKYAGIIYLRSGSYELALEKFHTLGQINGLLSNPGVFLEATALLRRDEPGDKERANVLLNSVVKQHLEGSDAATTWLQHF